MGLKQISGVIRYFRIIPVLLIGISVTEVQSQDLDVPYVPTPQPVVEGMLDIANVEPGDYVIDLGSGDGRIVISAAQRGAIGHGIDIDPERIEEARQNAETGGVEDRVVFLEEDIFETDFSQASVVTMYLLTSVNRRLRPRLFELLQPGTRVVSHSFDMGDWEADSIVTVESSFGRDHRVLYWVMPAQVEGDWSWEVEDQPFELTVTQQFQEVGISLESGGSSIPTSNALVRGERFSFTATVDNQQYVYSGRVEGDSITGSAQIHQGGESDRIVNWSAERSN